MDSTIILYLVVLLLIVTASRYLIYILSSPFYFLNKSSLLKESKKITQRQIEEKIKISVVVPAWNEEVGVVGSIRSLLASEYNNLEVILVDDGSTDNTQLVVNEFIRNELVGLVSSGKEFRFYSKSNGGKGSALNYGIRKSSGNVVVTMDADTIFDKDALGIVAKFFVDGRLDAAVGNVKVGNSNSFLGVIQQIEYTVGFYFKRTHSIFNCEYIIGGAFGVFRRDIFEKYGYFDEVNKTEDIELSTRLQAKGCKIAFIEDAIAYTEAPKSLSGLMKQRLRWKKGRLDTFYKHKELFFSKDKKHNKFLTHYLLPITIFYEIELLIEPFLIIFGIVYLYTTHNFVALLYWIIFTGLIHTIAFAFGSERNSKKTLLLLPIYFLLSYVLTFVEVYAMYASLRLIYMKKDMAWQNWKREGIHSEYASS